jgi:hypothetical protein
MYADSPSVIPFVFSLHDLSGVRVGPRWERFVRCIEGDIIDTEDLLAQAEMLLDCVACITNYKSYPDPVWSAGFYTTHAIHAFPAVGGGAAAPATLRAFPGRDGHPVSGSADPRTPPHPAPA